MDRDQKQKVKIKNDLTKNKKSKKVASKKEPKPVQASKTSKKTKKKQADDKSARVKKSKSVSKLFTWVILIAMIIGILVFLSKSETFAICDIEITGNSQVSSEIILNLSQINLEDNIFWANTIKAKNKISQNSYVKDVTIKRILPDKLKIEVTEKQKAYLLELDGQVAYIDKAGCVLEISDKKLEGLITLQNYITPQKEIEAGKFLNEEDLERLEDIQLILKSGEKAEINTKITSINIKDKNEYILNLPIYKKIIYIGDTTNLSTKMLRAKDILDKTMEQEGKIFVNGQFSKGFNPYFREETNN